MIIWSNCWKQAGRILRGTNKGTVENSNASGIKIGPKEIAPKFIFCLGVNGKHIFATLIQNEWRFYLVVEDIFLFYFAQLCVLTNFYPNLPIILQGYIRHIHDISHLCFFKRGFDFIFFRSDTDFPQALLNEHIWWGKSPFHSLPEPYQHPFSSDQFRLCLEMTQHHKGFGSRNFLTLHFNCLTIQRDSQKLSEKWGVQF